MLPTALQAIALRLTPQQDLMLELEALVQTHHLQAACVLTCVGSLSQATLRMANQEQDTVYTGPFEIVSLTGVMGMAGSHYHLAIADSTGRTCGGHLRVGCQIYTTAELVIGVMPALRFGREFCPMSGYLELSIASQAYIDTSFKGLACQ